MRTGSQTTRALLGGLLAALLVALSASSAAAAASKPTLSGVVNINTATPEQLQLLPGIGEARARAIVSLRKQSGGFKSLDDLLEVKGIGKAMLDQLRPFLSLNGKTTVSKL
jgi:competence protein ComEA